MPVILEKLVKKIKKKEPKANAWAIATAALQKQGKLPKKKKK